MADIDSQEEKRKAKVKKLKFAELWEKFDKMHISKGVKEKTAKDYRQNSERNILPNLGKLYIEEIEKASIVRLIDEIADRAPVMANRTLGLLSHFFSWSIGRGHISTNPTLGIPKAIKELPRKRVLSLSEMRSIYSAAGKSLPSKQTIYTAPPAYGTTGQCNR